MNDKPDLEARADALARRTIQLPDEVATVAGYNTARDVIPLGVDLNRSRQVAPTSPLGQATAAIMEQLADKYRSAPRGYSVDNPFFLGYDVTVNEGPSKGTRLGTGIRYSWVGGALPRHMTETGGPNSKREFLHVTIVEHPERKGVFLYQVVEGGNQREGAELNPYSRLLEAGVYMHSERALAAFNGVQAPQHGIVKR